MTDILYRDLSYAIIGAAMEVHSALGPGYLEAVYQAALAHELTLRGIPFEQYCRLKVTYKGVTVGNYESDFLVDEKVVIELKATSGLTRKNQAQAINYLTATGYRLAIMLNFGTQSLEKKRIIK